MKKINVFVPVAIATLLIIIITNSSPVTSQQSRQIKILAASDTVEGDVFGFSVAVKDKYGLVGAPYHDNGATDSGAVYLFDLERNEEIGKLTTIETEKGGLLGYAVDLSDRYALISQPYSDTAVEDGGAAYLFSLNTQTREAIPLKVEDIQPGDLFGYAVALSDNYALVGAPYQDGRGEDSGVAYLFDVITKKQLYKFQARDGAAGDLFGYAVALTDKYAIVAAPYKDQIGVDSGVVYLFDVITGEQIAKIFPRDGGNVGDLFGVGILPLESPQQQVLIGAPYRDSLGIDSGTVYLFDLTTQESLEKIIPEDLAAGDVFGQSLAMFDGDVLIGANYQDDGAVDSGAAYIFSLSDYQQIAKIRPAEPEAGSRMGYAVAGDANYGLIAAPYSDKFGVDSGVVYLIKK